jgi:acetoin utilization protein AcuB
MAPPKLTIDECMTPAPYSIEPAQAMSEAHAIMREHNIRHLPVVVGGSLVGIVSVRDLHLMETLKDVDPDQVTVAEAMSPDPYAVQLGTDLREVAINLGAHKYGSAVVMDGEKVVGMFTTVDAMRVLSNLL